jgi:hypothetical protein
MRSLEADNLQREGDTHPKEGGCLWVEGAS